MKRKMREMAVYAVKGEMFNVVETEWGKVAGVEAEEIKWFF